MSLTFYNQRRAKEKEKQKLNASIDNAETLINAKDDASLPHQEEEGSSLEPQPIEDIQITSEENENDEQEEEKGEEQDGLQEQEEEKVQIEETKKVSDAQKIKNAKQKANKTK